MFLCPLRDSCVVGNFVLLEAIHVGLVARDLPFSVVLFMAVWWL